jgi:HK97 family phage portal protein
MGKWYKFRENRSTLERPGTTLKEFFQSFGTGENTAGVSVTPETALGVTAVYACINNISQTIGEIPIDVFRETTTGKEVAEGHYLRQLLKFTPNQIMTSSVFRETGQGNILGWGNFYARIIKENMKPVELVILDPSKVTPKVSKNGRKVIYQLEKEDGKTQTFSSDDIFHIPAFSYNGIVGTGPIMVHAEAVGWGLALQEFGNRFFGNGATLSGILKYPGTAKEDVLKKIRVNFDKVFGTLKKSHQTGILDAGMEYQQLGVQPEAAQFILSRGMSVEEAARIFRMPPHLIQHLEKSGVNTIEQQSLEFVKFTMLPWIKKWEQEINRKLLLEKDKGVYFAKFNVDGLLRGDTKSRAEFYQAMKLNKILTSNQIRRIEGFNDMPQESASVLEGTNNIPDKEETNTE